jgi:hypothetical protein
MALTVGTEHEDMTMERYRIIQETITKKLPVELTELEIEDYARQLAIEVQKYETIEIRKKVQTKALTEELKEQRGVVDETAKKVNTGKEYREVECNVFHDYKKRTVEITRSDTMQVVETRAMTTQEYRAAMQTRIEDEED